MSASKQQIWRTRTTSAKQTQVLGARLAEHVQTGDLIGLIGELGTGKTQFVRGMASVLSTDEAPVSSPTFVMIHEYPPRPGRTLLVHIDAYRLTSLEDLESIGGTPGSEHGFSEELFENAALVVEWADRFEDVLGQPILQVCLTHEGEQERGIEIIRSPSWSKRWPELIRSLEKIDHVKTGSTLQSSSEAVSDRPCPICETLVPVHSVTFPFCSERCRMIDLGNWLGGDYTISRPIDQRDLEES